MPAYRSRRWRGCIPDARAVRARAHPDHQRPEGQAGRHPEPGSSGHMLLAVMAAQVGLDPRKDINWIARPSGDSYGAVRRRRGRCLSRLSPRAAGAARPQDRSRDSQHGHGQAVVAVFLLHAFGQRGFRPRASGRHQARTCGRSSRLPTSVPPTRSGPHRVSSMPGSPGATTTRLKTLNDVPYDRWREFDPEDSLRFFALRLHEVGMIKSSPTRSSPTAPTGAS